MPASSDVDPKLMNPDPKAYLEDDIGCWLNSTIEERSSGGYVSQERSTPIESDIEQRCSKVPYLEQRDEVESACDV